jgi:hypothetical protein
MIEPNRWDLGKAEVLGCEDSSGPAMTSKLLSIRIGTLKPKLSMLFDLPDLLLAVDPRVLRIGFELVDRNIVDGESVFHGP